MLLLCISRRLSGRLDCRGVNYIVKITEDQRVTMEPEVMIYKNRYSKKEGKISVLDYARHLIMGRVKYMPGTYIYCSSINKKQRKWVREE